MVHAEDKEYELKIQIHSPCIECKSNKNKTSIKKEHRQIEITSTILKSTKDNGMTIQVNKNKTKYIDKATENVKRSKNRRDTFKLKENPLLELRKQMNLKDKKPQLMSDARLEPNYTNPSGKYSDHEFSGNYEQDYNKHNNKLRKLYKLNNVKELGYVVLTGIECDFERDCLWKWATNDKDGFQVVSSQNYGKFDTGPMLDASNNTDGK